MTMIQEWHTHREMHSCEGSIEEGIWPGQAEAGDEVSSALNYDRVSWERGWKGTYEGIVGEVHEKYQWAQGRNSENHAKWGWGTGRAHIMKGSVSCSRFRLLYWKQWEDISRGAMRFALVLKNKNSASWVKNKCGRKKRAEWINPGNTWY